MRALLIIFGLVETIIPVYFIFFFLPGLYTLQTSLGSNSYTSVLAFVYFGIMLSTGFVQIIRGVFFKNANEKISKKLLEIGGALLVLLIPAMFVLVINPIYDTLNQIG